MDIVGIGGRTLRESWVDGPHAHLGIAVPGFPSLFLMYGPNTNTPGGSVVVLLEAQASYLRQALESVRCHGAAAVDVRPSVEAESDAKTQARFTGTAWADCDSWYRSRDGRNVANWPDYMRNYVTRTRAYDPEDYVLIPRSGDVCCGSGCESDHALTKRAASYGTTALRRVRVRRRNPAVHDAG
jgi:hypothetical protein